MHIEPVLSDGQSPAERQLIEAAVKKIVESGTLGSNSRLPNILTYVVAKTLDGEANKIKAFAIAADVFGRGKDFDPSSDSIVRVEFKRLRQALQLYYHTVGVGDPVEIKLPNGTYVPQFYQTIPEPTEPQTKINQTAHPNTESADQPKINNNTQRSAKLFAALTVMVTILGIMWFSFQKSNEVKTPDTSIVVLIDVSGSPMGEKNHLQFVRSIQNSIAEKLRKTHLLSVFVAQADSEFPVALKNHAKLRLSVFIEDFGKQHAIRARLTEYSGKLLFNGTQPLESFDPRSVEKLAIAIATDVRTPVLRDLRKHLASSKFLKRQETAWEYYLRATWIPADAVATLESEKKHLELARKAIAIDPNFGHAHSVIADKLSFLADIDPAFDTQENWVQAGEHALKATTITRPDPNVYLNLAIYNWHNGDMSSAESFALAARSLDRTNLLAETLAKVAPMTCRVVTRQELEGLIGWSEKVPVGHPAFSHIYMWISMAALNANDLDIAENYAKKAYILPSGPNNFYRYAAILHRVGKTAQATKVIQEQKANWPTLNPKHYAQVTIPRRCPNGTASDVLKIIYSDLANALEKQ